MGLPSEDLADLLTAIMADEDRNVAAAIPAPLYLADLAESLGESPVAVARELRRNTALTRLLKKALQIEARPPDRSKRKGRPRKDIEHWRDREAFWLFRHLGASVEEAYSGAASLRSREGRRGPKGKDLKPEAIQSAVKRLPPTSLGDLYALRPTPENDLLKPLVMGPKDDWKKWIIEV